MIVVKIGGGAGIGMEHLVADVANLIRAGEQLVIVHGASDASTRLGEQLGHPPAFITSPSGHTSRRTDGRTMEIVQMASRGLININLVAALQKAGIQACGLSGVDAAVWQGARKPVIRSVEQGRVCLIRDDMTGTVERVNTAFLRTLLDAGIVPVLCPPAMSFDFEPINVDADRAAARTARELSARALVLLTNVPGLLRSFPDEQSLIGRVPRREWDEALELAAGRMKKKVLAAQEALADAADGTPSGVEQVVIADARCPEPLTRALAGAGTVFA
jgi:acetylglutamate/LysW-gamma-L-alpha-aminoadipate kinase